MNFSERLRKLRKSQNLTQKDVYSSMNMSAIGYQRYEYGTREPAYDKLISLANYFDVPVDYLLGCGVFKHWDQIMEQKGLFLDPIAHFVKTDEVYGLTERDYMQLIPSVYSRIDYHEDSNTFDIYPYFKDLYDFLKKS